MSATSGVAASTVVLDMGDRKAQNDMTATMTILRRRLIRSYTASSSGALDSRSWLASNASCVDTFETARKSPCGCASGSSFMVCATTIEAYGARQESRVTEDAAPLHRPKPIAVPASAPIVGPMPSVHLLQQVFAQIGNSRLYDHTIPTISQLGEPCVVMRPRRKHGQCGWPLFAPRYLAWPLDGFRSRSAYTTIVMMLLVLLSVVPSVLAFNNSDVLAQRPLQWWSCDDTFGLPHADCARLSVPLDYTDNASPPLRLDLLRLPAAKQPARGSIVINFGGPGASGRQYLGLQGLLLQAYATSSRIHAIANLCRLSGGEFNLISWDPRYVAFVARVSLTKQRIGWDHSVRLFAQ